MNNQDINKPTRNEAEEAVRTLIRWAGDNPNREGLKDTPARLVRSYEEFFDGYNQNPSKFLETTFDDIGGFNDMVLLRDISFVSFCEHHILPIIGYVDIAYLPDQKVVGISKIARIVEVFAKRLQIQERFTAEIAQAIDKWLKPRGVAVSVISNHHCMSLRGVKKDEVRMQTCHMIGEFQKDMQLKNEFLTLTSHKTK